MYKSETFAGYKENEELDEVWNSTKLYLLTYVNQDSKDPFTEKELYVALLRVSKHILDNSDRSLWTVACHIDGLNRFTRQFLLRSSSIDSKLIGMQNLSKSLEYVRSKEYRDLAEAVKDIISDSVNWLDLEKVLYEILSSYRNQFAMGYQILQSVTGMFRNHDA